MTVLDARRVRSVVTENARRWLTGRNALVLACSLLVGSLLIFGLSLLAGSHADALERNRDWLTLDRTRLDAADAAIGLQDDLATGVAAPDALDRYNTSRTAVVARLDALADARPDFAQSIEAVTSVLESVPTGAAAPDRAVLLTASARVIAELAVAGSDSPLDHELALLQGIIRERSRLSFVHRLVDARLEPAADPAAGNLARTPGDTAAAVESFYESMLLVGPNQPNRFGEWLLAERQPEAVREQIANLTISPEAQLVQASGTWALSAEESLPDGTGAPSATDVDDAVNTLTASLNEIAAAAYRAQTQELDAAEVDAEGTRQWELIATVVLALLGLALGFGRIRSSRINGDELRLAASTDRLTGLGNRAHLEIAVEALTERSPELVLLHIDLDHFKPVNDTYGHAVGDRVLQLAAERLRAMAELHDGIAARLGGDEFVLVLPGLDQTVVDVVSRELLDNLQAFVIGGLDLTVGASIGVARGTGEVADLLINADLALYQAKRTGRGQASTFRAEAAAFVSFVRDALIEGRVQVVYQPQLALRSGRCVGAEVLARLTDRTGTLVPAKDWLGIAEWLGVTDELFEHVVSAVADHLQTVPRPRVQLWFNVAPNDLIRPGGAEWLVGQLRRLGLPMQQLGIELTETEAITDLTKLSVVVGELRDVGLGIALDDFGARNTPIGHLVELPVTRVKLDGSLIAGIGEDMPPSSWVVRAMADLAGRLNIEVIAEGISSGAQVALLTKLGVPAAQGYLLGLPGPIERVPESVDIASLLQTSLNGVDSGYSVGPLVKATDAYPNDRRTAHPPSGYQR